MGHQPRGGFGAVQQAALAQQHQLAQQHLAMQQMMAQSQQQGAIIAQLQAQLQAQQARQLPGTVLGQPQATLHPPDAAQLADGQVQVDVMYPAPFLNVGPRVVHQTRRKTQTLSGGGTTARSNLAFKMDTETIVYALTGAAVVVGEGAAPDELDDLKWFDIEFLHSSSGEKLDDGPAIASSILGRGERPSPVGHLAWHFKDGGVLTASVLPFHADIRIDVTIWCIRVLGGSNYCP